MLVKVQSAQVFQTMTDKSQNGIGWGVFPCIYRFKKGTHELSKCSESVLILQPTMPELLQRVIQIKIIRFQPAKGQLFTVPPNITLKTEEATVSFYAIPETSPYDVEQLGIYKITCDIELNPKRTLEITADCDGCIMIYKITKSYTPAL